MTETKIYNALIEKYNNFEFRYIINNNGKKLFLLSDLTKYFQFTNNLSFTIAHLLRCGEVMVTVVVHHSP